MFVTKTVAKVMKFNVSWDAYQILEYGIITRKIK